jgi:hypothetical protein
MTAPFLNEFLFEINEIPQFGPKHDLYTIKDYFFYNSNTQEYGYRGLVVPVSCIINKETIPDESTIKELINNKVPIMRRTVENLREYWSFENDKIHKMGPSTRANRTVHPRSQSFCE